MSSSVFTENPPLSVSDSQGSCGSTESNLVVIYGKNGINVDRNGLERLIDNNTISSVSVVRISSPTPSMKSEENDIADDKSNEETDAIELLSSLDFSSKGSNDQAELVGLTVEEFYPPEEAKKLAKEILNYAGVVNPLQIKIDYEFQRFVIQNDHCYTPLTSPSQVKNSRPSSPMSNSTFGDVSKIKQYGGSANKNKKSPSSIVETTEEKTDKETEEEEDYSDYSSTSFSDTDNDRDSDLDFNVNDRRRRSRKTSLKRTRKTLPKATRKRQSTNEKEHSLSGSNNSTTGGEEERRNPFIKVLNRNAPENRKNSNTAINSMMAKQTAKPIATKIATKSTQSQRQQTISDSEKAELQLKSLEPSNRSRIQMPVEKNKLQVHQIILNKSEKNLSCQSEQPAVNAKLAVIVEETKSKPIISSIHTPSSTHMQTVSINRTIQQYPTKGFMPLVVDPAIKNQLPAQISIQTHESSSSFINRNELSNNTNVNSLVNSTNTNSTNNCIGITNDNNIGHLSVSDVVPSLELTNCDLTAEHSKQLDLIDDIVKNEMRRSNVISKEPMNENIPQIVKMLENTEKAVMNNVLNISTMKTTSSSAFTNSVEDIDIASAPLLDNAEEESTEDLLQQVAELMDSKSIQDVIEKEVLGNHTNAIENQMAPPEINNSKLLTVSDQTPIHSHVQTPQEIQMPAPIANQSPIQIQQMERVQSPLLQLQDQVITQQKSSPLMSLTNDTEFGSESKSQTNNINPQTTPKERQILRGGRLIILPPIEAPTTRAKRRAQAQVSGIQESTNIAQNSSNTANLTNNKTDATDQKSTNTSNNARKRLSTSNQRPSPEEVDDYDSSNSSNSEDDPNRLWCICRQPHNNRFMICCDKCADWFHGTCVNISKMLGREMEMKGIEWTCPNCVKLYDANGKKHIQKKITEIFEKKPNEDPQQQQPPQSKSPTDGKGAVSNAANIKRVEPKKNTAPAAKKFEVQKKLTDIAPRRLANSEPVKNQIRIIERHATPIDNSAIQQRSKPASETQLQNVIVLPTQSASPQIITVTAPANSLTSSTTNVSPSLSTSSSSSPTITVQTPQKIPTDSSNSSLPLNCIVCKKDALPNSIYCGDECIRKHVQNALNLATKASKSGTPSNATSQSQTPGEGEKKKKIPSSFEEALAKASEPTFQQKNKIERVLVFERKSGRILTGPNAPTTANLKKWLLDNPTFEVIQPNSPQALAFERNKTKPKVTGTVTNTSESTTIIIRKVQDPTKTATPGQTTEARNSPKPKLLKYPQHVNLKPGNPQTPSTEPKQTTPSTEAKVLITSQQSEKRNISTAISKTIQSEVKSPAHSKNTKKQVSNEQKITNNPTQEAESLRLTVKRTLKEQLTQRTNELKDANATKLTPVEIFKFAEETEDEMFKIFNKDVNAKYRAKYRSLLFNIRDRKNQTLFQKICEKQIEPKQLVRMSPEELASQELAQWRHNENKHQLEMIKKSELDMLSCAKNYVLKTHKGEEVIESKSTDRVSLDIMIPVEDVVTVLNNSGLGSGASPSASISPNREYIKSNSFDHLSLSQDSLEYSLSNSNAALTGSTTVLNHSNSKMNASSTDRKKVKSKDKERDRERERDRRYRSKDKHKHRRKSRSRSRDRDRERERDKDRERDRDRDRDRDRERRHKDYARQESSKKDDSNSSSKINQLDKREDNLHEKNLEKNYETQKKLERSESVNSNNTNNKDKDKEKVQFSSTKKEANAKETRTLKQQKLDTYRTPKEYSLIDQILQSTKTIEEAANLVSVEKQNSHGLIKAGTSTAKQNENASGGKNSSSTAAVNASLTSIPAATINIDSDQESTSTTATETQNTDQYQKYANISSIIWRGSINMIDVATFQIIVQPVSGMYEELENDLPSELDVVGRIVPETVWEYIRKIKVSRNKEIVLMRLIPATESENIAYSALYMYLDKRKRLGVLNTRDSPNIKDFYILPLAKLKTLPSVLHRSDNADFLEDETRPDLLVGIIIRIMDRRSTATPTNKITRKDGEQINSSNILGTDDDRFGFNQSQKIGSSKSGKIEIPNLIAGRLPSIASDTSSADIKSLLSSSVSKVTNAYSADDADEPYSPGGSSDDEINTAVPKPTISTAPDVLKEEMDKLNKEIEARKMEIAEMLGMDHKLSENNFFPQQNAPSTSLKPTLANISIPSNLQEILASIKSTESPAPTIPPSSPVIRSLVNPGTQNNDIHEIDDDDDDIDNDNSGNHNINDSNSSDVDNENIKNDNENCDGDGDEDEEYVPVSASMIKSQNAYKSAQLGIKASYQSAILSDASPEFIASTAELLTQPPPPPPPPPPLIQSTRLAQLSEAELLSMVPDDEHFNARCDIVDNVPHLKRGIDSSIKDNSNSNSSSSNSNSNSSSNNNNYNNNDKCNDKSNEISDVGNSFLSGIGTIDSCSSLPKKKPRWDNDEPPPPGLEDEYM